MIQDTRDFLLRNVRENGMKKPWGKMTEGEQKLEIERATDRAEKLVQSIVDHVAQGEFPVIHAIVDNFKIKDGTVTITAKGMADDDVLLTLNHAGQKAVKIVVADAQQFDQTRSNIQPDPDEPGLPGVKVEIQPEEVNGTAAEPEETPDEPVVDEAEQAEGEAILQPKSDQWRGGYNSRMAGHWREENPFGADLEAAQQDWFDGWDAANESGEGRSLNEKPIGEVDAAISDDGEVQSEDNNVDGRKPAESDAGNDEGTFGNSTEQDDDSRGDDQAAPTIDQPKLTPPEETEPRPLTDDEVDAARNAGIDARRNGFAKLKNPHEKGSQAAEVWAKGYDDEKAREKRDNPKDF